MTILRYENGRSVLASLRSMFPERGLRFSEALRVAELQAIRLLELLGVEDAAVPSEVVSELPRIRVEWRDLPTSGVSFWDGQEWVIGLNRREPVTRQRFTIFHEYKHIVDHGRTERLYRDTKSRTAAQQAEQVADYFAGCVLMSRMQLKRAWARGLQTPVELARHFDVSPRAVEVRLAQVGLTDETERCLARAVETRPRPRRYYRELSASWLVQQEEPAV